MRTVLLDPGHGGTGGGGSIGSGVVGRRGLAEKDVAFVFARCVADRLLGRGVRAILTREADQSVALARRAALAVSSDAERMVSLHFNHHADPRVRGTVALVHDRAGAGSDALARALVDRVCSASGHRFGHVERAPIAILDPRGLPAGA